MFCQPVSKAPHCPLHRALEEKYPIRGTISIERYRENRMAERRQSVVLSEIKRRDGKPDGIMWTYKYYSRPNSSEGPQGSRVQDVSSMVSGPYYATVDRHAM